MDESFSLIVDHHSQALDQSIKFLTDSYGSLPKQLHHYLPNLAVLESILTNREMWASHAYDMADKKELWYGASLLLERIEIFKERYKNQHFVIDEFFEMAADVANPFTNSYIGQRDTFILSLTEEGDSSHQWENYANDSKGFCLDFDVDISNWERWAREHNIQLIRVKYNRAEQIALIDGLLQRQIDFLKKAIPMEQGVFAGMPASVAAAGVLEYYVMSFKQGDADGEDYSPENEWRVVYGMQLAAPVRMNINATSGKRFARLSLDDLAGLVQFAAVRPGANASVPDAEKSQELSTKFFAGRRRSPSNLMYSFSWKM